MEILQRLKQCSKCGEIKNIDHFYKSNNCKDGYMGRCKCCLKNKNNINLPKNELSWKQKICQKCNLIKPINEFHKRHNLLIYMSWCKNCHKLYRKNHIDDILNEWIVFFKSVYGNSPRCSICDKSLTFRSKDIFDTVVFDHRCDGKELIQQTPSLFYHKKPCDAINRSIWLQSNFGILCWSCNKFIPTKNRIIWLNKLTTYIKETL